MRTLIIAPHADDEVLGCGGLIARRVAEGQAIDVAIATVGDVHHQGKLKVSADERRGEMARAATILGIATPPVLFPGYENRLDTLPFLDLIGAVDDLLARLRPDEVYLPYPSHHQDHRRLFEAGHAALREKAQRDGPRLVALYEYPYVAWAVETVAAGRLYVDVSAFMETKRAALACYASQLAADPAHPLHPGGAEALARARGMECGATHAELFYLLKMVQR